MLELLSSPMRSATSMLSATRSSIWFVMNRSRRKRACSPGKAAELRDRDKDRDLVEVDHVEILSLLQNRFHHFPSHGNSSKARYSPASHESDNGGCRWARRPRS